MEKLLGYAALALSLVYYMHLRPAVLQAAPEISLRNPRCKTLDMSVESLIESILT